MIRRILDRIVRAKFVRDAVAVAKAALGITSPSREFLAAARAAERRPYVEPVPLPWYAARGPGEPWETPELAAAARRVRRLIRRHWWALAFDYDGATSWAVRRAMATPPKQPDSPSLLDAVRQLEALGMVPRVNPDLARELAERYGASWDRAEVYAVSSDGSTLPVSAVTLPPGLVVVPAEQCPNCAHVESECQCGDLRDCW